MTGCTLIFVFTESRENQHCSRHWLEDIGRQLCRRCPSWLFLDTMSVLHCTDTFHHRDSASLLPILSQSLFCLGIPVSFFICLFSLLFLWDSQWSVPLWCLHLFSAMQQQLGTAARKHGSLSRSHSLLQGDLVKDRLRILNESIHSKVSYTEWESRHTHTLIHTRV